MSWPLGYGTDGIRYRGEPGGEVRADGVRVTDAHGFLEVRALASALGRGAPPVASVQLRVRPDARGRPYLFVGEVRTSGRQYPGVHAIDAPWAAVWLASLGDAVHAEVARRVEAATRATAPRRAVRAAVPTGVDRARRETLPREDVGPAPPRSR